MIAEAPANDPAHVGRAALLAGLVGAVAEMVIVLPAQYALGAPPPRVFQAIASGLLGAAAFRGGAATVVAGVALHLLISLAFALAWTWPAARWPVFGRRWLSGGLALGAVAYVVMTYGVVPLSRFPIRAQPPLSLTVVSVATHLVAFGLPIAFTAARVLGLARPSPERRR